MDDYSKRANRSAVILCQDCARVNFHRFFNGEYPMHERHRLSTVNQAVHNTACTICKLLLGKTRNYLETNVNRSLTGGGLKAVVLRRERPMLAKLLKILCQEETDAEVASSQGMYFELVRWAAEHAWDLRMDNVAELVEGRIEVRQSLDEDPRNNLVLEGLRLERVGSAQFQRIAKPFVRERRVLPSHFNPVMLRHWLDEHVKPTSDRNNSLDDLIEMGRFRLIDVESGKIVPVRKLARYACLSYVWGPAKAQRTRSCVNESTLATKYTNPDYVDLKGQPQVVRDAIALLREIGEQYLWVDSVCIHQWDYKDKEENVSRMADVYSFAYFTIVAANGEDADAGLMRLRPNPQQSEHPTLIIQDGILTPILPDRPRLTEMIEKSKWNSRGWTYQEHLLSKACVVFTEDEVLFQCGGLEEREAYKIRPTGSSWTLKMLVPVMVDQTVPQRLMKDGRLNLEAFSNTLLEYTKRDLTFAGDRLDAFTGILERLHRDDIWAGKQFALSGLPPPWFAQSLLWDFRQLSGRQRRPTRLRLDTGGSRYLPSWSWVGWTGPVDCYSRATSIDYWVIDRASIFCNLARTERTVELELCKSGYPLRVTLHLWARITPCYLRPAAREDRAIDMYFEHVDGQFLSFICSILQARCAEVDWSRKHHLLSIPVELGKPGGSHFYEFLLIEGDGSIAERIGKLKFGNVAEYTGKEILDRGTDSYMCLW